MWLPPSVTLVCMDGININTAAFQNKSFLSFIIHVCVLGTGQKVERKSERF